MGLRPAPRRAAGRARQALAGPPEIDLGKAAGTSRSRPGKKCIPLIEVLDVPRRRARSQGQEPCMTKNRTWMGRPIDELDRGELAAALEETLRLLRSVPSASFVRPEVEVRETASATVVG